MKRGRGGVFEKTLPCPPDTDDEIFVKGFEEIVPLFIKRFKPDILVTQLGVDTFRTDPITHLNLTTNGFEKMVKWFKDLKLPWIALGGGGYNLINVARAWTLAWAIMTDKVIDKELPQSYIEASKQFGFCDYDTHLLRDEPFAVAESGRKYIIEEVESVIHILKNDVLPLVEAVHG